MYYSKIYVYPQMYFTKLYVTISWTHFENVPFSIFLSPNVVQAVHFIEEIEQNISAPFLYL